MIKDNRKTKENSKNQEQFINWINEYFAEAPVTITNDKTKLYITHNNYPISLENTSIIDKFTNKNKGIEFTREQAIKEAEILRNELAVEVKNYKAVGIDLMQSLIKQYFNQFFAYKKCDTDYKLVFDNNYPSKFKIHYYNETYGFDFEDIISEFIADKRLVDIPFTDVSEFSKAITVDKIYNSGDYSGFVYKLLDTIVSYNFEDSYITLKDGEGFGELYFYLDGENITDSDGSLTAEVSRYDTDNAYDDFEEIVDYVLHGIEYFISNKSDEYKEQKECAEYAKENYEKDIEQLITNLESEIKIKYPDFVIDNKYIYATDFDNSDFSCVIGINDYKIVLDITDYVFKQSGFPNYNDELNFADSEEGYCYEVPYVNKFDYEAFLEVIEKELNKVKEEILKDLNGEQKECAEYAEENYEEDIEQLITNLESEIKIDYPDFEIDTIYIDARDFDNSDFNCVVVINDYRIGLDSTDYVFKQIESMPHINKFDYEAFLEIVEEKLNGIKEEILEHLSK
ncbi:hypothetical protein P7G64_13305 [Enterococcus faecalis]|uniref:hypothetical protein n=1 Tax=Enterococcus faecalis TaxID=1351 RepID=UPI00288D5A83|nr:hypothetical protein [Enterococcus faecalis]MDT2160878.1 hypothetical protein [Enterococcus faecalis]